MVPKIAFLMKSFGHHPLLIPDNPENPDNYPDNPENMDNP